MEEVSLITREVRRSRSIHDLPDEYKTLIRASSTLIEEYTYFETSMLNVPQVNQLVLECWRDAHAKAKRTIGLTLTKPVDAYVSNPYPYVERRIVY